jgi:hypothetical protein
MEIAHMFIIGLLLAIVGAAGGIWCLIEAFSEDTTQGVLCLCVPFYAFYYVIARIDGEKKWIILGLILVGIVGRIIVAAVE